MIAPADIKQIVHCQSDVVLVVSDADVTFEAEDFRISDVGAIQERAQEKQSKYGEYSIRSNRISCVY